MVLNHERGDEVTAAVKQLSGAGRGEKAYIADYQKGIAEVAKNLSEAEMAELRRKAIEWTNQAQPVDQQRKWVKYPHSHQSYLSNINGQGCGDKGPALDPGLYPPDVPADRHASVHTGCIPGSVQPDTY